MGETRMDKLRIEELDEQLEVVLEEEERWSNGEILAAVDPTLMSDMARTLHRLEAVHGKR